MCSQGKIYKEGFSIKDIADNELQILINEYNQCNDRIESFINRQDTILQISIAIIGGLVAFTLTNNIPEEFYIIVPVIPIILFTHILYHYTRIMANQGYRSYLQKSLNSYLYRGRKIMYNIIAEKFLLNTNPMSKTNSIIYPLVILFCFIYSIIMSNLNVIVVLFNIILLLFTIYTGIKFFRFFNKLNYHVEKYSKNNQPN